MFRIFYIATLLFISLNVHAQRKVLKILMPEEANASKVMPDYKAVHKDSASVWKELNRALLSLHYDAYIVASLDSAWSSGDTLYAYIDPGLPFKWAQLKKGNVDEIILDKIGFKERFYRNKPFSYRELVRLEKSILDFSENEGHPFASISLDTIAFERNKIKASLKYSPGPEILFDSIVIKGNSKIKQRFLARHLRIFKDQPFNQQKVKDIERLMKELSYVMQSRPMILEFRNNKAIITLFLEDKKINSADGIVGFLPNQNNNNKLLITGELNLHLKNLFGTGKALDLEWKKFNQLSQTINMGYSHPKLLGSNLDFNFNFNLLKQDTSFLNVLGKANVSYRIGGYSRLNIFANDKISSQLASGANSDTTKLLFGDFKYFSSGLGYEFNTLDDIYFPHRGWHIVSSAQIGNKEIQQNPSVNPKYYNGVTLKSTQVNAEVTAERYFKFAKRSVLLAKGTAGKLFNDPANIFLNDLYRVGGLKTLRGFNENNFYASTFAVTTMEYRFYTEQTSYFLLFIDQGYIDNVVKTTKRYDYPLGVGAGVSFTTKAGVFTFVYALGHSNDQKISLNQSKIHFGLISRF